MSSGKAKLELPSIQIRPSAKPDIADEKGHASSIVPEDSYRYTADPFGNRTDGPYATPPSRNEPPQRVPTTSLGPMGTPSRARSVTPKDSDEKYIDLGSDISGQTSHEVEPGGANVEIDTHAPEVVVTNDGEPVDTLDGEGVVVERPRVETPELREFPSEVARAISETRQIAAEMQDSLAELRRAIPKVASSDPPGIGHNEPPIDIRELDETISDAQATTRMTDQKLSSPASVTVEELRENRTAVLGLRERLGKHREYAIGGFFGAAGAGAWEHVEWALQKIAELLWVVIQFLI